MLNDTHPSPILVGFVTAARADSHVDMLDPPKDGNTKDPIKVIEQVTRKWAEFDAEKSPYCALTAEIKHIVAVAPAQHLLFDSSELPGIKGKQLATSQEIACAFIKWVNSVAFRDGFSYYPRSEGACEVAFYGFDVADLLRIVVWNAITVGMSVPIGMCWGNNDVFDPLNMVVETTIRKQARVQKVLHQLGILVSDTYEIHTDAAVDAVMTAELCCWLGLCDNDAREVLLASEADVPSEADVLPDDVETSTTIVAA